MADHFKGSTMRTRVIAAAAVSLAGCAQWTHPTATEADFARDSYTCQVETAGAYPASRVAAGPAHQAPGRINCTTWGSQTNCTTTPGAVVPAPTIDANRTARAGAFDACMRARGYR